MIVSCVEGLLVALVGSDTVLLSRKLKPILAEARDRTHVTCGLLLGSRYGSGCTMPYSSVTSYITRHH